MNAKILAGGALLAGLLSACHGGGEVRPAAHAHGTPRGALGASAAFDAQGRLWAVHLLDGALALRRSDDLGATWSEPRTVAGADERIEADGESRPRIAAGPGGELYLSWTQRLDRPYTGTIRFTRSLDGGASFDAARTVHADRQEIGHRFDALALAPDGKIFVAWVDKRGREAAQAAGGDYRGAAIYYAVSTDRGASFRGDYKIADHGCECCRIALLPQADGGVLALWRHVFEPNARDHALARLRADGTSEAPRRVTFDDWRIDACPHHGPALAEDAGGRLHAVWFSQAPQRAGVFYARLGAGETIGQRRVGGERAEHADIAASGGRVAVVWKEFEDGRSLLKAAVSEDGGGSWRESTLASTADASDQPRLLTRDGRFYVLWNTRQAPLRVVRLP